MLNGRCGRDGRSICRLIPASPDRARGMASCGSWCRDKTCRCRRGYTGGVTTAKPPRVVTTGTGSRGGQSCRQCGRRCSRGRRVIATKPTRRFACCGGSCGCWGSCGWGGGRGRTFIQTAPPPGSLARRCPGERCRGRCRGGGCDLRPIASEEFPQLAIITFFLCDAGGDCVVFQYHIRYHILNFVGAQSNTPTFICYCVICAYFASVTC